MTGVDGPLHKVCSTTFTEEINFESILEELKVFSAVMILAKMLLRAHGDICSPYIVDKNI